MSREAEPDRGAIELAERLIALLDEGAFTATYKFALLLALLDSCLEGTSAAGAPPDSVTTADLARRVTELCRRMAAPPRRAPGRRCSSATYSTRSNGSSSRCPCRACR